jgi:hypothetical protein
MRKIDRRTLFIGAAAAAIALAVPWPAPAAAWKAAFAVEFRRHVDPKSATPEQIDAWVAIEADQAFDNLAIVHHDDALATDPTEEARAVVDAIRELCG